MGVARWSRSDAILSEMKDMTFWDCIEYLRVQGNPRTCKVIIEDPGLNKPVFLKRGANTHGAMQRVAQNVGMNKAYAKLIIEYCDKYGIPYLAVKPTTKKWDDDMFRKVTGIKKKVSQHVRDAVKLVWGM